MNKLMPVLLDIFIAPYLDIGWQVLDPIVRLHRLVGLVLEHQRVQLGLLLLLRELQRLHPLLPLHIPSIAVTLSFGHKLLPLEEGLTWHAEYLCEHGEDVGELAAGL